MSLPRLIRTVRYLKLRQIWYQIWRRVQRMIEPHPKCGSEPLGEFTFLNLTANPKGWNDASLDMLWRYNLHYFDWINSRVERVEEDLGLIQKWIEENPKGSIPGWDPYPTSLRIVNWIKWLSTFSHKEHKEHKKIIEMSLKDQLSWLETHIEWHIMANHLMANLKALIIGNKWLGCGYAKWMRLYKTQIAEQVLPDGGHFERSVMYHAIILEDVLDVMKFCGEDAVWLKSVAEKMLRYLVNMTGPEGKIAMFNDSADGIAKPTEWLCRYAQGLGVKVPVAEQFVDFPDAGYTRMTAGDFILFVDTGAIGPDYQPGHAHADTLTYELYYKGRKIVTDVGTSEYRGGRRAYERSTAAHNVVEAAARNSSEVWGSHRVGARARITKREIADGHILAEHDGYGFMVGREWRLTDEGLSITEKVSDKCACVTRVHLTTDDFNSEARRCRDFDTRDLRIEADGGILVEKCEYALEFGKLAQGTCLSAHFDPSKSFTYTIKRKS